MSKIIYMLLLVPIVFLIGCATGGPEYTVRNAAEDEAIVYFYRPARIVGAAASMRVLVNGKLVVRLGNGGFFPYTAKPGELNIALVDDVYQNPASAAEWVFWGVLGGPIMVGLMAAMEGSKHLYPMDVLESKAGEKYFYRYELGVTKTSLTRVPNATAEQEIRACRLLQPLP